MTSIPRSYTLISHIFLIIICSASPSSAEDSQPVVGIAPLDADMQSMRRTLRELQELVNERDPEAVQELISPNTGEPHREAILSAARSFIDSLPEDTRYEIRTDIGRNALVPVGPEKMQVQVRGTEVVGDRRGGAGLVSLQLEAVETEDRRQWLITELRFPGQGTILVGGWPWTETIVAATVLVLFALLFWRWRRTASKAK